MPKCVLWCLFPLRAGRKFLIFPIWVIFMSEAVTVSTSGYQSKIQGFLKEVQGAFLERDEIVEAVLLAILGRQHVLMLGPPGTAKSKVVQTLNEKIDGSEYFRTLAHRLSPAEQFFGPYKLTGLKQDKFERKTKGYGPEAHFIFLDEVFKANAGVLNAHLTMMEERLFEYDGFNRPIPLLSLFGASNELPQEDELAPFHDRMVVRLWVERIKETGNRIKLLKGMFGKVKNGITLQELMHCQEEVEQVTISDAVAETANELIEEIMHQGIFPSDRRCHHAMQLVRAHAWLNGRTDALVQDLSPLQHVFWETQDQIKKVQDLVIEKVNPLERKAREIEGMVIQSIEKIAKADEGDQTGEASQVVPKVKNSIQELNELIAKAEANGHQAAPIVAIKEKVRALYDETTEKYFGIRSQ